MARNLPIIPRAALLKIHKYFLTPRLDYGDVIYGYAFNGSFKNNLHSNNKESVQYNAALSITGAIRGSYREKLYQEPGLEPLKLQQ